MEKLKLYCRGKCCGEVTLREDGVRVEICAAMEDPGDGLYRAVLAGERGELSLGVMEPKEGKLVVRRRPERCETAKLGALKCVQAQCAYQFRRKPVWTLTERPAELFRDEFLRSRLEPVRGAWWRRTEGRLVLALPLRIGEAFPLEAFFCFARVERVEQEVCVVYAFDERELPLSSAGG